MATSVEAFITSLDSRIDGIIDACTMCGRCAEVCPTPAVLEIEETAPEALATGVIDILKGAPHDDDAEAWARACCGTGHCIDVCAEGINPRFMLTMARRRLNERAYIKPRRDKGRKMFQWMSRGVRMLSRLQMPTDVLARLNPPMKRAASEQKPEIIFYTGCNLLKTPHIGLLCLDVLDRLDVRYEVYGGPGNCCGVLQFRPGDTENAGCQAIKTVERFQETGAAEVLAWCPTCHIQFGEIAIPSMEPSKDPMFDMNMFPVYLHRHLDKLKLFMTTPVKKKVALFEFPGSVGVTEAVTSVLSAIPGIEVVDLGLKRAGYQLSALETMPEYRARTVIEIFQAAEVQGVDSVCSVFHADHRELVSHDKAWPFDIINYMDLIGESLGIVEEDIFKRLKTMQDVDAIVASSADTIAEHGMDLDEARDAVMTYILEEQHVPIDRAAQAKLS